MNKEIKDRLDKLENELKESKDEIHSLKSSVSLTIERGIRKLLSRFTRKQIILGSLIVLFSISIIGIAGTVTKTYTFSSGETISASKFNTNFDTLYTLVNGNLDGSNIGIDDDAMVLFTTPKNITGDMGGRSGADALCALHHDSERTSIITNSCSNVRAVISVSGTDEIRDMASNYSIPTNRKLRGINGAFLGDGWDNLTGGASGSSNLVYPPSAGIPELFFTTSNTDVRSQFWTGTDTDESLSSTHCVGWTDGTSSEQGTFGDPAFDPYKDGRKFINAGGASYTGCNNTRRLLCVCY